MCNIVLSKNKIKEIVKLHQKKYRNESSLFIAEGQKVLDEMIASDIEICEIFALKEFKNNKIKFPINIIDEVQMKKIATTESPCEVLTIAKKRTYSIEKFTKLNNIILLDSISDPGNLGTIIRSAAAFNIQGIILYSDCTDLYSTKVIRSTAGNFFKIPIIHLNSAKEIKTLFKQHSLIATALSKENNILLKEAADMSKRIIMFGSEANGLSGDLISISDKNIKLEMGNNVESLNLAVCASVIMYELSKYS